jgi:hypothetical protein
VRLPAWAVRRTRRIAWVYFGTLVLAAAGSLVMGGMAIVSGAVDDDYGNVAGGVVSFMIGGCWAALARFARPRSHPSSTRRLTTMDAGPTFSSTNQLNKETS